METQKEKEFNNIFRLYKRKFKNVVKETNYPFLMDILENALYFISKYNERKEDKDRK